MAKNDLIGAVEAAYRLHAKTGDWLTGVCESLAFEFDNGFGVLGHILEASGADAPRVVAEVAYRADPALIDLAIPLFATLTASETQCLMSRGWPCGTAREIMGPDFIAQRVEYARLGIRDVLAVRVHDLSGAMILVTASRRDSRGTSRAFRARWSKVAVHIAAGSRLRRLPDMPGAGPDDAILDGTGRVVDANGCARSRTAREQLRSAALEIDRARCREWRNRDEALELWRGLIAGRWSLVDHFESDGRRFLIARRNDPQIGDPRALTLRERQVFALTGVGHSPKVIAYELGVSPSTVSLHLASVKRKLGASSLFGLYRMDVSAKRSLV